MLGAAQAEHHVDIAAPVNAEADALHFNFRREIAEDAFGCGMKFESRCDQHKARRISSQSRSADCTRAASSTRFTGFLT